MKSIASTQACAGCARQPPFMVAIVDPPHGTGRTLAAAILLVLALLVAGHALAQPVLDVSTTYARVWPRDAQCHKPVQPLFVMNTGTPR